MMETEHKGDAKILYAERGTGVMLTVSWNPSSCAYLNSVMATESISHISLISRT